LQKKKIFYHGGATPGKESLLKNTPDSAYSVPLR
jgi:hypothetical protein